MEPRCMNRRRAALYVRLSREESAQNRGALAMQEAFLRRFAAAQGFACCVLFVVQFSPAAAFAPNRRTHPAFADALRAARDAGVRVLAYDCAVTPESMVLRAPVPVTGL